MNYRRLYCELKVNDKNSGELLAVADGVYYLDEEEVKGLLRCFVNLCVPSEEIINVRTALRGEIKDWLKSKLDDNVKTENSIYDVDITYLDDKFYDEDGDDEE